MNWSFNSWPSAGGIGCWLPKRILEIEIGYLSLSLMNQWLVFMGDRYVWRVPNIHWPCLGGHGAQHGVPPNRLLSQHHAPDMPHGLLSCQGRNYSQFSGASPLKDYLYLPSSCLCSWFSLISSHLKSKILLFRVSVWSPETMGVVMPWWQLSVPSAGVVTKQCRAGDSSQVTPSLAINVTGHIVSTHTHNDNARYACHHILDMLHILGEHKIVELTSVDIY